MDETENSGGILQSLGEAIGGFISGIPPAIGNFFTGVGKGASIDGFMDWTALLLGVALLVSVIKSIKRGSIIGSVLRGVICVALLGWAVS